VLDIPADTGKFGLFENLHGATSGQEFADSLRAATQRYYGTASRAFLSEIVKQTQRIADVIRRAQGEFVSRNLPTGATEQVGRAAMRFGLIAAAGELAAALGITGWEFGIATEAAATCFAAWLERRGHSGPVEIESGIEQVRHFFALHGASRFGTSGASDVDPHGRTVFNRAGFRKADGAYCIYPTVFRNEISAGYDLRSLAAALAARGLLRCDSAGRAHVPTPVKNPDNNTTIRMFVFEPSIVGEEVAE
jgi:putative DNA primase/helicase